MADAGLRKIGRHYEIHKVTREDFSLLAETLDIRSSYGIGVNCSVYGNDKRSFMVEVKFGCEPNRVQELADEVFVYKTEPLWFTQDIERIASWITAENLQDAAKKYLNTENFVTVFQVPEK